MLISRKNSALALQVILALVVVFHLLVLVKIIPHTIVWGGKFESYADVLPFELVSLALNLSFILLIRASARKPQNKPARIGIWLMFVLFALNTVGNLFAETLTEKLIATPITFVLALLSLHMALQRNN